MLRGRSRTKLAGLVDPQDYLFRLLAQRIGFAYEGDGELQRTVVGVPFGTAIACFWLN